MGLVELAGVLKTVVSLFLPSFTTQSQEERSRILEQLSDEQAEKLSNLDRQLYTLGMVAFATMRDYLRKHWDDVQKDII